MNAASAAQTAGGRYTLLTIALLKRMLTMRDVGNAERLRLLEQLDSMTEGSDGVSAAALVAIDPMSNDELSIVGEAMAVDGNAETLLPSFGVLSSCRVFEHFVKFNAGLRAAIALGDGQAPAPPQQPIEEPKAEPEPAPPEPLPTPPAWCHPM